MDTNVLIFDTFEDSEFHGEAASALDSLEQWCVPAMVFHELLWFFRGQGTQLSRASTKIQEYLTNEKTSFSSCTLDDIRFAMRHMKDYRQYNDLVILSAAKRLGVPLFSFDEELNVVAGRNSVKVLSH